MSKGSGFSSRYLCIIFGLSNREVGAECNVIRLRLNCCLASWRVFRALFKTHQHSYRSKGRLGLFTHRNILILACEPMFRLLIRHFHRHTRGETTPSWSNNIHPPFRGMAIFSYCMHNVLNLCKAAGVKLVNHMCYVHALWKKELNRSQLVLVAPWVCDVSIVEVPQS